MEESKASRSAIYNRQGGLAFFVCQINADLGLAPSLNQSLGGLGGSMLRVIISSRWLCVRKKFLSFTGVLFAISQNGPKGVYHETLK